AGLRNFRHDREQHDQLAADFAEFVEVVCRARKTRPANLFHRPSLWIQRAHFVPPCTSRPNELRRTVMKRISLLSALALSACAGTPVTFATIPQYVIQLIDSRGPESSSLTPAVISPGGTISGVAFFGSPTLPRVFVRTTRGTTLNPNLPGYEYGQGIGVVAVNDSGVAIGWQPAGPQSDGAVVVWSEGSVSRLPPPVGATFSEPWGINSQGWMVGDAYLPDISQANHYHAILWRDQMTIDLGASLPLPTSFATGINDEGSVIGVATDNDSGEFLSFVTRAGVTSALL